MEYVLAFLSLVISVLRKETNGLSVSIFPKPAVANVGDTLTISSVISKNQTENWNSFVFIVNTVECKTAAYSTSSSCTPIFDECPNFSFNCNYIQFNLLIPNVNTSLLNWTVKGRVTFSAGDPKDSEATTIKVKLPLKGVSLSPNGPITKIESETQVFECFAMSLPISILSWNLNGSIQPTSSPPSTTTETVRSSYIYTAKKGDNGKQLSCTAVYGSSSFTVYSVLNVLYRPTVTVSPNYDPFRVLENTSNLQLNCNVTDANPTVSSIIWTHDNSEFQQGATLTISSVSRTHAGLYTCNATNSVGSSDPSANVQLEVLYGPDLNPIEKKVPNEGTQLLITCSGQSHPALTDNDVTWTKQNNNTFYRKGKNLVIDDVNRFDSGTYVCSTLIELAPSVGQSNIVTERTTVEVDVAYRPTVTISPKYAKFEVIENTTNFILDCEVTDSNPAVSSYRWFKDGLQIDGSIAATYTISTVLKSDTGNYSCDAENTVGSSESSTDIQLNVLYGVELHRINKKMSNEGNQLTITCSGESYPRMVSNDVKWSKQNNNTFTMEGLQLVIKNVNRLDRGTYVCSVVIQLIPTVGDAVNVTGTTTVEVDILYRPDVSVSPDQNPYTVIENTANLHLFCNVTGANPNVTSFTWYKNNVKVATHATYTISTVYRSDTGRYSCKASNHVGSSDLSSALQLEVQYGVSLKFAETEITINESERWELSCIGDGNPLPKITCMYEYNSTAVGEQNANITYVSVDHANCMDTGLYMCYGNNTIGKPVSQSADIKVTCRPRTYSNVKKEDIFISRTNEGLNISTRFISFPLSNISWSRKLPDGNFTDLDNTFTPSTFPSDLPYETISILQKVQLNHDDFGIYLVNASNIHGSFVLTYHVIAKKAPDEPTNISASCDVTSMRVTWISRFDGGQNQLFRINLVNMLSNKTISKEGIADKGSDEIINEKIESLSPDTLYLIFLEANNYYGTTKSTDIVNCTTLTNHQDDQPTSSTLVGGITGSISALLIVVIVIGGLYWWRRRQGSGGDKDLINRGFKETEEEEEEEEEEEGLKENPLYVTSGEASIADVGPVYGVVNKKKQKKEDITFVEENDQGPVCSHVQKSTTQGKKKQKEKKIRKEPKNANNCKDIELGTVYENSDKLLKHKSSDELYANAEEQGNGVHSSKVYSSKKNKDGLIYADLDLMPVPSGKKFVIRGHENRTNYAIIDLSIKVDPLPSDDEDEDKDNGNGKSPGNEGNE